MIVCFPLPGGVDMTLSELQDMAARQQQQIQVAMVTSH